MKLFRRLGSAAFGLLALSGFANAEPLKIAYSDWPGWVAWEIGVQKGWFKEAGVDDPGLLTLVVGLPNVLGGVVALLCTDKYGRRPLLLWSFGGMAVW